MRVGVIRNPASGRGGGSRSWPSIESRLRDALPDSQLILEETTSAGSAVTQARNMAALGLDAVIACGGDGTVTDVMQGLLGSPTALAILPMGTGNDFARTLGVGPSLKAAFEAIRRGDRIRADVGIWRQEGRCGHFLNVAGCGFDACVAERVNLGFRLLRGRLAYLAAVMSELARFRAVEMRVEVDGEVLERAAMLCAVANAKSYGGGMLVAPTAEIDDGLFDVVLVERLSRTGFLRAFPSVFKGTHLSHPRVTHRRGARVRIQTAKPVPFLADGELLPPCPTSFEILPSAIEVMVAPTDKVS